MHTRHESRWATGFYWGDLWRRMCRLRSQSRRHLIVTNWAAERSFTSVYRSHWWTTSQLLSLWLSNQCRRDCDLIPSNDTCVVILPQYIQQVSQLHTLVNDLSQLYRAYVTTLLLRLCSCETSITVVTLRQLSVELGSLVTSHVYFSLSISEVPFLKGQRSIYPRTVDAISALE